MTVDDVYELIIKYLVQRYLITLRHYNLPNYTANKQDRLFYRMCVKIDLEAIIE